MESYMAVLSKQKTRTCHKIVFQQKLGCLKHFSRFYTKFQVKILRFLPPSSTFGHLNGISILLKSKIMAFSGSKNLWRLCEILSPYKYFFDTIRGSESEQGVQKLVKLQKLPFFNIKSAINKKKLLWMFFVNSRQELTKIQFFTKSCDI